MLETRTVPKGSKHEGMVAPNMEGLRPRGLRPQDLRPQGLRPQGLRPGLRPYEVYSSLLKTAETGRLKSTDVD